MQNNNKEININTHYVLLMILLLLSVSSAYYLIGVSSFYENVFSFMLWDTIKTWLLFAVFSSFSTLIYFVYKERSIRGLFVGSVVVLSSVCAFLISNAIYLLYVSNDLVNVEPLFYLQVLGFFIILGISTSVNSTLRQMHEDKNKRSIISKAFISRVVGGGFIIACLLFPPVLVIPSKVIYSLFLMVLLNLYVGYIISILVNFLFAKISR